MFDISKDLNLLLAELQRLPGFWATRVFHIYASSSRGRECPYGKMAERRAADERNELITLLCSARDKINLLIQSLETYDVDSE